MADADGAKPIRRVVTGTDKRGRSCVTWDGPAPAVHKNLGISRYFTDFWIWNESPAPLSDAIDAGTLGYEFPGPPAGGHLRVVEWPARPADYDPAQDDEIVPVHPPKIRGRDRTWDRGGNSAYASAIHKTETIDYGIVLAGERVLILEDRELVMRPGDTIVQVAAWHQWKWVNPDMGGLMLFDIFAARFPPQPTALPGGTRLVPPASAPELPADVKPARRIVIMDGAPGGPSLVSDAPSPDVRFDPARPGFASTRLWVTDASPANPAFETLNLPHAMVPPPGGSVLRIVTLPSDAAWKGRAGPAQAAAFFAAMGAPEAAAPGADARHPYMQKTRTLDLCAVLEGEPVLVLDTQDVPLRTGDIVVQRGTRHAWSNPSARPAVVAIASHDGR